MTAKKSQKKTNEPLKKVEVEERFEKNLEESKEKLKEFKEEMNYFRIKRIANHLWDMDLDSFPFWSMIIIANVGFFTGNTIAGYICIMFAIVLTIFNMIRRRCQHV